MWVESILQIKKIASGCTIVYIQKKKVKKVILFGLPT